MLALPDSELVAVLGYDGSPGAERALVHVADVMRTRPGWVHVVHVDGATPEDEAVPTLAERVQRHLSRSAADWRFESRTGDLSHELLAVANELAAHGTHRLIVIVVGRPGSHHPDLGQSVLAELFHSSPYSVLMVP